MLRYSDITKRYTTLANVQRHFEERLRDAAAAFIKELEVSLELPPNGWIDSEGKEHPFLEFCRMSREGEVIRASLESIQIADDFKFTFAILLRMLHDDEDYNDDKKMLGIYIQTIVLRETDSALEVFVRSSVEFTVKVSKEPVEGRFSAVIERLKRHLVDNLERQASSVKVGNKRSSSLRLLDSTGR